MRASVHAPAGGQSKAKRRKGGTVKDEDKEQEQHKEEEEREREKDKETGKDEPEEKKEGKENPEREGDGVPPDDGLVWGGHMKSGSTPGCTDNSGRDVVRSFFSSL